MNTTTIDDRCEQLPRRVTEGDLGEEDDLSVLHRRPGTGTT